MKKGMSRMKAPLLAALGALVMVGVLFLSFVLSSGAYRSRGSRIILPTESAVSSGDESSPLHDNHLLVSQVVITEENVQDVIASLSRPDQYSALVHNTVFYGEGASGTLDCSLYVKNGAQRIDYQEGGVVRRSVLLWQDACYAWRAGDVTPYQGARGSFTLDSESMLPSYETVCALPKEQILAAELKELEGESCIAVSAQDGELEYGYYISIETGLLRRASIMQGEKTLRAVVADITIEEPADSLFVLPGTAQPVFPTAAEGE